MLNLVWIFGQYSMYYVLEFLGLSNIFVFIFRNYVCML